jgi:hypothetical protein
MTNYTEAAAIQTAANDQRAEDIITAIEVALTDAGHSADFGRKDLGCRKFINEVDGIYVGIQVKPQGGTSYKPPTKLRLTFGSRMVRQFPEPKNGFDAAKITAAVIEYVESEKARKASEAKAQDNHAKYLELADKINAEFGISRYASTAVKATSYGLKVEIASTVTEDQARAIMAILDEARMAEAPEAIPASEFYANLPRLP